VVEPELHPQRVPNAESATFDENKFVGYLLNPSHRGGWGKAKFFQQFGLTQSNWQELADQIIAQLPYVAARQKRSTDYGEHYEAQMLINTPSGRAVNVTTAWLVPEDGPPKFLSAYPGAATTTTSTVGDVTIIQDDQQ
jgi:Domain of unknown function (DUF6883)